MKTRWPVIKGILAAAAMAMLILDTKTAIVGAQKGVILCIQTVIPSLFPFFILSILLTGTLVGRRIPIFSPVSRLFRIPQGTEGLFAAGFLGGYPVGAQCVSQAFEKGILSASDARRMLAICNNCGPAFLFGMAGAVFTGGCYPWLLWVVQFVSSLTLAWALPGVPAPVRGSGRGEISIAAALERALRVMAAVCGWVILFRVIIAFLDSWCLWLLPPEVQVLVSGALELSNGCFELLRLENVGLRFVICAGMLNFGGICVTLQTFSVATRNLDRRVYFPGKAFQWGISMVLAYGIQVLFFPQDKRWHVPPMLGFGFASVVILLFLILRKRKNKSSIPESVGV